MIAAATAILMATSPLVLAHSAAAAEPTAPASLSAASIRVNPTGTQIQPDQFRASKMMGSTVYDLHNRDIGSVKDLVIDRDGKVAAAVIDFGTFLGMGGKYLAVPLDAIKTDHDRLTLDVTKEQLQQAQAYNLTEPNTGSGSTAGPATGGQLGSGSGR
jgi:sporulation protein YlmC with PRC-barrel domain